jgi:hypothetical protein
LPLIAKAEAEGRISAAARPIDAIVLSMIDSSKLDSEPHPR